MAPKSSIGQTKKADRAGKSILGLAALGLMGALAGSLEKRNKKEKQSRARDQELSRLQGELRKVDSQIDSIDNEISNLRSGFLGSFLNSDQIDSLQSQRNQLVSKRNQLIQAINELG